MKEINDELYYELEHLGIINEDNVRNHNVGDSNYAAHTIQPWTIWIDYPNLTSWDHDIIKRILRVKLLNNKTSSESRIEDYEKVIHICQERIRQIKCEDKIKNNNILL